MQFFAKGIRIVKSFESSNNPNAPNGSVPADLEVASQLNVMATQPVLVVPYDMIMTGTKAREELGPNSLAEESLNKNDLPAFYLMVKLLKECERGTNSHWFTWLEALPWWFCNGSSLSEPTWELLPKTIAKKVQQEHDRFRLFEKAIGDADCLNAKIRNDEALVHWAFCIVATRSIPLDSPRLNYTDAQLIPNADMFNHAHSSQAAIELQNDPKTGNCLAVATKTIMAGSPLRRSYGNLNPSHLMVRFGIVDETSPVAPSLIEVENNLLGCDPAKMVFTSMGDVAQEVWDVLLFCVVLVGARDQQSFLKAVTNGDMSTKRKIHSKYHAKTVQALQEHVGNVLTELQGLLQKGSCIGTDTIDSNPRLFFVNKHNLILSQVFTRVQNNLVNGQASPVSQLDHAKDVWGDLQKY